MVSFNAEFPDIRYILLLPRLNACLAVAGRQVGQVRSVPGIMNFEQLAFRLTSTSLSTGCSTPGIMNFEQLALWLTSTSLSTGRSTPGIMNFEQLAFRLRSTPGIMKLPEKVFGLLQKTICRPTKPSLDKPVRQAYLPKTRRQVMSKF